MDLSIGLKPNADGNDLIISIVETCSRYIKLKPNISTKALPVVKAISQCAGIFGVPGVIVSFRNQLHEYNIRQIMDQVIIFERGKWLG
jgi:hypothetical protein